MKKIPFKTIGRFAFAFFLSAPLHAKHPCAEDVQRYCPEAKGAPAISQCMRTYREKFSRACVDYSECSPARLPSACLREADISCASNWDGFMGSIQDCLKKHSDTSSACREALNRMPDPEACKAGRVNQSLQFLEIFLDDLSYIVKASQSAQNRDMYMSFSRGLMGAYSHDPSSKIRAAAQALRDSADGPSDKTAAGIDHALAGVLELTAIHEWPPLGIPQRESLQDRITFVKSLLKDPGGSSTAAALDRLHSWLDARPPELGMTVPPLDSEQKRKDIDAASQQGTLKTAKDLLQKEKINQARFQKLITEHSSWTPAANESTHAERIARLQAYVQRRSAIIAKAQALCDRYEALQKQASDVDRRNALKQTADAIMTEYVFTFGDESEAIDQAFRDYGIVMGEHGKKE